MSDRINARIDIGLKKRAVKIFDRLGISEAEAIRLFYAQVELHQGSPFPRTIPNATTPAAFDDTNKPGRASLPARTLRPSAPSIQVEP